MSEKNFKSPIENALRGCQFGVKLGKNRGYLYWILTPTKGFFRFRFRMSVPNFIEIGRKLRPWEHGQTDRHTHTDTDHTGDFIICPMLWYSNGTDKKLNDIALLNISSHSYGALLALMVSHIVIPVPSPRHKWCTPHNRSQTGWYAINLSRRDGRLSWPHLGGWIIWIHTEMLYLSPIQVATGPGVE